MEFYLKQISVIELYLIISRITAGDCVCSYHIVLLIPAVFKFIMREIPANIYSV